MTMNMVCALKSALILTLSLEMTTLKLVSKFQDASIANHSTAHLASSKKTELIIPIKSMRTFVTSVQMMLKETNFGQSVNHASRNVLTVSGLMSMNAEDADGDALNAQKKKFVMLALMALSLLRQVNALMNAQEKTITKTQNHRNAYFVLKDVQDAILIQLRTDLSVSIVLKTSNLHLIINALTNAGKLVTLIKKDTVI